MATAAKRCKGLIGQEYKDCIALVMKETSFSDLTPKAVASEEDAARAMFNLLETDDPKQAFLLFAALYAAKGIPDITDKRVWIQEFAASLNRKALLSNDNVQPFREYGYQYMRGFP